jgi:hypothetical protein
LGVSWETGQLPSKSTDLQDLLRTDRTCEEVQEFPLGKGNCDIPQPIRLGVCRDLFERGGLVLGNQERVLVNLGLGPDLSRLWGGRGGHDSDQILERYWVGALKG